MSKLIAACPDVIMGALTGLPFLVLYGNVVCH